MPKYLQNRLKHEIGISIEKFQENYGIEGYNLKHVRFAKGFGYEMAVAINAHMKGLNLLSTNLQKINAI
ncbi:MAG: hypothetical protein AB8U25_05555 [Rickettsiales endosymbiont of Dermacentor nuttalli]